MTTSFLCSITCDTLSQTYIPLLYYFLCSITCDTLSQTYIPLLYYNSFYIDYSKWMLFLLEFSIVLFGLSVMLYYTRNNFPWSLEHFQNTLIITIIIWLLLTDVSCHKLWTLMSSIWLLLKLDKMFLMTWYDFKLSLRSLFEISKNLSVENGT